MRRFYIVVAASCGVLPFIAAAQTQAESTERQQQSIAVTIYNENLALVRDVRTLRLPKGVTAVAFRDVASAIDATSVHIASKSHPGKLSVLEQNYEYDLISPQKLLEKYVGKQVTLYEQFELGKQERRVGATLLSTNGGLVFRVGDDIRLNPPMQVILPSVPADLAARPTLVWLLDSRTDAEQTVEASYLTSGMSWRSDYVAVVDKDDSSIGLNGWVTLNNTSGATYRNAKLKLMAGDVHRAPRPVARYAKAMMADGAAAESAPAFEERALFEYHIYELGRPATIKENQTKQLALLSADGVKVEKRFIYQGPGFWHYRYDGIEKHKVGVFLKFRNSAENHMGMPLPRGVVRVYKADVDGSLQFIGEDNIDHTPKDENVEIKMGEAFDVVGEHKQTNYRKIAERVEEESYEVRIRNHKKTAVDVRIECGIGGDWEIVSKTHKYEKETASKVVFTVHVNKDAEAVVKYTVRVRW